jgi:EAL domain-containing protein (putative c-di-GMP-specific phosphodiesterase class I)/predicted transcriptional regulator
MDGQGMNSQLPGALTQKAFIAAAQTDSDNLYYDHLDFVIAFRVPPSSQPLTEDFLTSCRRVKMVARVGEANDSLFMVYLAVPTGSQNRVRTIQQTVKSLFNAFKHDNLNAYKFIASSKMGISVLGVDSHSIQSAVTHAFQITMEQGENEKQRVNFFDSDLQYSIKRHLLLEQLVTVAIENNEVKVVYQPIVSCHTWLIEGYEILSRFKMDPVLKTSTRELIAITEDLNLISELDLLTYDKALSELASIIAKESVFLNINVSANTRQNFADLFGCITLLTDQYKLDHRRLLIDINPMRAASGSTNHYDEHLSALAEQGAMVALADLSMGFDLGNQLASGKFQFLRLDEQFFKKFHREDECYQVVKLLVKLCQEFNIKMIIEGVNTVEQARVLVFLGVDYLQGDVFTLPVDSRGISGLPKKVSHVVEQILNALPSDELKFDHATNTVGSIASRLLPRLDPGASLFLVNEYFKTESLNVLPIIVDNQCVGIIDRNQLNLYLTPTMGTDLETEREARMWQRPINSLMKVKFHSVESSLDVRELIQLVREKNYQLPLVIVRDGHYVGLLTERDLMDYLLANSPWSL